MTQSGSEQSDPFSPEEVKAAESAEQAALTASQNAYLTRRVVALRAQLSRLEQENESLRGQLISALQADLSGEVPKEESENSPEGSSAN